MLPDDVRDMTNEELGDYMRKINKELYRISRLKRMSRGEKEIRSRHLLDQLEPADREMDLRVQAEDWKRAAQGLRPSEGVGRPGFKPRRRDGRLRLIRARRAAGLSQQEAASILGLQIDALRSLESIEESDGTRNITTADIWQYASLLDRRVKRLYSY